MKTSRSIVLAAFLTLAAGSASAFNLEDAAKMASAVTGNDGEIGALADPQTSDLIGSMAALDVTPQQALGGAGALLGLARNQLQPADYAQLLESAPGLAHFTGNSALGQLGALNGLLGMSPGEEAVEAAPAQTEELLGNVDSLADVDQAFSALGMESSMVGQFAPLLLQYLGGQGVAGGLLQNLAGIWGVRDGLGSASPQ